jgi:hypothetical protein
LRLWIPRQPVAVIYTHSARVQSFNGGFAEYCLSLGASERDGAVGVSADGLGSVYISGYTEGDLNGDNPGGREAIVAKYRDNIPTPGNDDGKVDGLDYLTWATNFGQGPNDSTTVPEPTSITTALLALVGLLVVSGVGRAYGVGCASRRSGHERTTWTDSSNRIGLCGVSLLG